MSYYRPRIGAIIKNTAPKDPVPRLKLSEKQLNVLRTVSEVTFAIILAGGVLTIAAVAPNALGALAKIGWNHRTYKNPKTKRKEQAQKVTKAIYYLKRKGYIELKPDGDDFEIKITQKGRKKTVKLQFDLLQVKRSRKWDGRWWMVVADVPMESRSRADLFREKLKSMNFYPLQRTVWVFPYDPRDEVDFAAAYYRIQHYVTTMRVDHLDPEDAEVLHKHFREQKLI